MLYEIEKIRQHPGEPKRRWFFDVEMDVTIWVNDDDKIIAFQICYDKLFSPHALTWRMNQGFFHHRIDDGEEAPIGKKKVPILVMDGHFEPLELISHFRNKSGDIESSISAFILNKLKEYTTTHPVPKTK